MATRTAHRIAAAIAACGVLAGPGVLLAGAGPGGARAPSPATHLLVRMPADSAAASALALRDQLDSARAVLAPAIAESRRLGDRRVLARWLRLEANLEVNRGNGPLALAAAGEAARLAAAERDTVLWMYALRTEATALNLLGRYADAKQRCLAWMRMAERRADLEYLAWGRVMLGYFCELEGELAEARGHLEWAIPRFAEVRLPLGERYALTVLGNILKSQGDFPAAAERYRRVLALARAAGDRMSEARALNNLGLVEWRTGSQDEALRLYRQSNELHRADAHFADLVIGLSNVSNSLLNLGRPEEAIAAGEEAMAIVEREGLTSEVPWQQANLAEAYQAAGRRDRAMRMWRAVIAAGESAPVEPRTWSATGLARCLVELDSLDAALGLLTWASRDLAPRTDTDLAAQLECERAALLDRLGRDGEALRVAEPLAIEMERQGIWESAMAAWVQAAASHRRLGHARAQARALERASAVWEKARGRMTEPETREAMGETAQRLAHETVLRSLAQPPGAPESTRVAAAFERMQQFKTRTLLERMAGPKVLAGPSPPWLEARATTAEEVRRRVLRDGELMLEVLSGPDTTWMFALTRDRIRLCRLPGERALDSMLAVCRSLVHEAAGATAEPELAERVLGRLGDVVFADLGDLLAEARTVIVAPDGPLHLLPFSALPTRDGRPLSESHAVVSVPSTTLLARLRERGVGRAREGLFAFALARRPDGGALGGAAREVRMLGDRYAGVRARVVRTSRDRGLDLAGLAGFGALHFASHSHLDDEHPWRSGILVRPLAPDEEGAMLTSADIAAMHLRARMAVLSSCESGGGRVRAGEGMMGLANAFLVAGVPCVVGTLWPVDDAVTARLMEAFYRALSDGATAADALRRAQEAVRGDPRTRHPFYWAGFVLVGEGATRVPLHPTPWARARWGLFGGSLTLAGLAAVRGWRRARPRDPVRVA